MFKFNFPATKFVKKNTLREQLEHVLSEAKEIKEILPKFDIAFARFEHAEKINSLIREFEMEAVDLYHSSETYFRILIEEKGQQYFDDLLQKVEDKNRVRGYYD